MKKLNLRKLYPLYYTEDCCIEVSDEVAEQIEKSDRTEHAYAFRQIRSFRAGATFEVRHDAMEI